MYYVVLRYLNGSKFGTFTFDTEDEAIDYGKQAGEDFTVSVHKDNGNQGNPIVWERK